MLCLAPESISPSPQLYFGSYCYHSGAQQHMNSQTYTKPTSSILEDLNELTISNALSPSSPLVEWDGPVPRKKARLPNVHRITPSENDLDLSDDELKSLGSRKPQISPVARLESIPEESEATFLLPIPRALEEDDSMDWSSTAQSVDDSTAEDVERRLKHKRSCIDLFDPQFVPRGTVSKAALTRKGGPSPSPPVIGLPLALFKPTGADMANKLKSNSNIFPKIVGGAFAPPTPDMFVFRPTPLANDQLASTRERSALDRERYKPSSFNFGV